ncbi:epidermal growth factor-like protein [Periplaneta americana]|uniref:epidermal growth factor-like protein n=1 Tax=Periplaneta americana TaxID=6978 RepID=UPI0037E7EEE6
MGSHLVLLLVTLVASLVKGAPEDCPVVSNRVQQTSRGLANLLFMCGTTQVEYDVPVRWVLRDGPYGSKINVTIYEKQKKTVPLCCPGYIRDESDVCVPKCKANCPNGVCVSPGVCQCLEGYTLNSLGECVVSCPCGCPHGSCRGSTCICEDGYVLDGKVCNPICSLECQNADCTAPGICTCFNGYRQTSELANVCKPHCSMGCTNGNCTGPDICVCNKGYYKSKSGRCLPYCFECEHGDCVRPYTCVCHSGYRLEDESCKPICDMPCVNSTCTAPNTCTCLHGYERSDQWKCAPHCFPTCRNANCVRPNHCECLSGYFRDPKPFRGHRCKPTISHIVSSIGNAINNIGQ